MRHLHAVAHSAHKIDDRRGAATSRYPPRHLPHGVTQPCISHPNYPARLGLDSRLPYLRQHPKPVERC
jgi:hypothetical protein